MKPLALLLACACSHVQPGVPDVSDTPCGTVGRVAVRVRASLPDLSCADALGLVEESRPDLAQPWTVIFTRGWVTPYEAKGLTSPATHVITVRDVAWLPHELGHAYDVEHGLPNRRDW